MANEKVTIQDLAERLAERNRCSRARADMFLRKVFNQIKSGLATDSFVKIKGLGTFKLVTVSSRSSVDVNTGERIEISEHQRLVFIPDNSLKERVNKPFEKFETVTIVDEAVMSELSDVEALVEMPVVASAEKTVDPVTPEDLQETFLSEVPAAADSVELAPQQPTTATEESEDRPQEAEVAMKCQTVYIGENEPESDEPVRKIENSSANVEADNGDEENDNKDLIEEGSVSVESDTDEEVGEHPQRNLKWLYIASGIVGAVVLLIVGYMAGYYRLFESHQVNEKPVSPVYSVEVVRKTLPSKVQSTDTLKHEAVKPKKTTLNNFEQSKAYEQLPDGDYLITGTQEVHEIKVGETLLKLSKRYYGNKRFVKYIVFYNHLDNADCVPLGTELKIPRLVDKEGDSGANVPKE